MMKKVNYYLKIPLLVFLSFLVLTPLSNRAQSLKRQCITSYGSVTTYNGVMVSQTVGQPYGSNILSENRNPTFIGFQQPINFSVEKMANESLNDFKLNIYPNPATYSVSIQTERIVENSVIRVTDLNGKLVMSDNVAQLETYSISCESWANGIYIITMSDKGKNMCSLKLIISK